MPWAHHSAPPCPASPRLGSTRPAPPQSVSPNPALPCFAPPCSTPPVECPGFGFDMFQSANKIWMKCLEKCSSGAPTVQPQEEWDAHNCAGNGAALPSGPFQILVYLCVSAGSNRTALFASCCLLVLSLWSTNCLVRWPLNSRLSPQLGCPSFGPNCLN